MSKKPLALALALAALTAAPAFAAEATPKTAATKDAQAAQLAKEVSELRHQLAAQGAELKRLSHRVAALRVSPRSAVLCVSGCTDKPAPAN